MLVVGRTLSILKRGFRDFTRKGRLIMVLRRLLLTATVALASTTGVATADSITLQLSSHSSDATSAGLLLASFTFEVTGTTNKTLKLTVTNLTSGNPYNMNEVYFNSPETGAGALTYAGTPPDGWTFMTSEKADGFGTFDYAMIDGTGEGNLSQIAPNEFVEFFFTFTGTATASDFAHAMSTEGFLIAAKFVNGAHANDPSEKNEDSAYGALVPLPPALPMGIVGLLGVAFLRRRTQGK